MAGTERDGPRLTLSGPWLVALSLVLVCAVAWAFFMGFMVGRGQSPHEEIHAMTGMLEPPKRIEKNTGGDVADAYAGFAAAPGAEEDSPPAETGALQNAPAVTAAKAIAPAQTARPAKAPQQRAVNRAEPQFIYTFQLAAFKTQREAENLQKNAASKGLKTSIRKSGKVFLVTTSLRGGQSEVSRLNATIKSLKLGKPMQLSKKPANPQSGSQNMPGKKRATAGG